MVRERLAADEAARADAERQRRAVEQEQADRAAVCAGVEALSGDDITDRVAQARAAWEGMPAMPEAWPGSSSRLPKPAAPLRSGSSGASLRLIRGTAARSCPRSETLAEHPSYNDIRSQCILRKQWQAIARDVEIDAELRTRFDAASQKLEAQELVHRDAKGQQQVQNLQRAGAGAEIRNTRHGRNLTLKQVDQVMKDVKLAVRTMGRFRRSRIART